MNADIANTPKILNLLDSCQLKSFSKKNSQSSHADSCSLIIPNNENGRFRIYSTSSLRSFISKMSNQGIEDFKKTNAKCVEVFQSKVIECHKKNGLKISPSQISILNNSKKTGTPLAFSRLKSIMDSAISIRKESGISSNFHKSLDPKNERQEQVKLFKKNHNELKELGNMVLKGNVNGGKSEFLGYFSNINKIDGVILTFTEMEKKLPKNANIKISIGFAKYIKGEIYRQMAKEANKSGDNELLVNDSLKNSITCQNAAIDYYGKALVIRNELGKENKQTIYKLKMSIKMLDKLMVSQAKIHLKNREFKKAFDCVTKISNLLANLLSFFKIQEIKHETQEKAIDDLEKEVQGLYQKRIKEETSSYSWSK